MTSSVRLDDLEFSFRGGDFRLRISELEIPTRQTVALVGPSGAGKTTLLNLIAGIGLPTGGKITTEGEVVSELGDLARRQFRARKVGLVFQEFELIEYLSVLENILLPYRITPVLELDEEVRERAATLARRVGLEDKLRRHPSRLSQGERQRVAFCRALSTKPPLILADEPTGNLDPHTAARVLDLLLELAAENESTVLTVTHDPAMLPRFERTLRLESGPHGAVVVEDELASEESS